MNRYIIGQIVVLEAILIDEATGALTDDATFTWTVYKPDLTTSAPTPAHPSTGMYTGQVTADQEGWWTYASNSTGTAAGAGRNRFRVDSLP